MEQVEDELRILFCLGSIHAKGFPVGANLMQQLGFEPIRITNPARQLDYIHRPPGVEMNDLHDENVFVNRAGQIFVIDPVPMMEQESKLRRRSA